MMARIRTIKPEFWSSPDTASCDDPWARLLFISMWNWADDCGRGTANPKELAGFAFPNDEKVDSAEIRRMLGEIRRAFGVVLYMVDARPYYAIPSWDTHQKIDKRSGGKHPAPEEGQDWDPDPSTRPDQRKRSHSENPAESSENPAEVSPSPRRELGAGTGEQGNRGITTTAADKSAAKFDEFWSNYPRKVKKEDAKLAWAQALRRKVDPDLLVKAALAQAAAWKGEGKELKYIPHPSSWLRSGAYNDAPEQSHLTLLPGLGSQADPVEAFDAIRELADAQEAARLLGMPWIEPPQPPSDPTQPREWSRLRAVEFIDANANKIREALSERQAG